MCSLTAVVLLAFAPPMLLLDSGTAFWLLLAAAFVAGIVAVGVTVIELLAGYRGWPQTVSLTVAALLCLLLVLFMAFVAAGGAGT